MHCRTLTFNSSLCLDAHTQRPPGYRCVSCESNDEEIRIDKDQSHLRGVFQSPSATGTPKLSQPSGTWSLEGQVTAEPGEGIGWRLSLLNPIKTLSHWKVIIVIAFLPAPHHYRKGKPVNGNNKQKKASISWSPTEDRHYFIDQLLQSQEDDVAIPTAQMKVVSLGVSSQQEAAPTFKLKPHWPPSGHYLPMKSPWEDRWHGT